MLGVFGFALSLAYLPGAIEATITPRWAALAIFLPLLLWRPRVELTAAHWTGIAFLAYAAISGFWATVFWDWLNAMMFWVLIAASFCLGSVTNDAKRLLRGIGIGLAAQAILVVFQLHGLSPIPQQVAPAGLFDNKNFMGEVTALVLVWSILEREWWIVLPTAFMTVAASSREAVAAVAVAGLAYAWKRSKVLTVVAACVFAAIGWQSTRGYDIAASTKIRTAAIEDVWDGLTVFGRGAGSYYTTVLDKGYHLEKLGTRTDHAHNDYLEAIFEYGIGAILLFAVAALALLGHCETDRLVFIAFLAECCLGFPLHLPVTSFLGAFFAGRLCARLPRLRWSVAGGAGVDAVGTAGAGAPLFPSQAVSLGCRDIPAEPPCPHPA